MRKLFLVAAPLALVACADEAVDEAPMEEVAAEPEEVALVTANGTAPGTFSVTASDGTPSTSILNADGTYQDLAEDGSIMAEGSWEVVDGKTCFTPVTEGVDAMCYTEGEPGEDGSFTATPDEGDPVTVAPASAGE